MARHVELDINPDGDLVPRDNMASRPTYASALSSSPLLGFATGGGAQGGCQLAGIGSLQGKAGIKSGQPLPNIASFFPPANSFPSPLHVKPQLAATTPSPLLKPLREVQSPPTFSMGIHELLAPPRQHLVDRTQGGSSPPLKMKPVEWYLQNVAGGTQHLLDMQMEAGQSSWNHVKMLADWHLQLMAESSALRVREQALQVREARLEMEIPAKNRVIKQLNDTLHKVWGQKRASAGPSGVETRFHKGKKAKVGEFFSEAMGQ